MLFDNINFLLRKRGAPPLFGEEFVKLDPTEVWDIVSELSYPFEILNTVDLEKREKALRSTDIKLVVLDVDGVLTDGGMHYHADGSHTKVFNVKDGFAINRARKQGIEFAIISASSQAEAIRLRAETLGIKHVFVGGEPKIQVLETLLYGLGLAYEQVAFVGDDVNDVPVLQKVGIGAVPSDAVYAAKMAADIVLGLPGGKGCVREFLDTYVDVGSDKPVSESGN